MIEKPAKNVRGFLLYNHFKNQYWFRVYDETNRRIYKDYTLNAEDIEVTIQAGGLSLYESEAGHENKLGWSSKVLGHKDGT